MSDQRIRTILAEATALHWQFHAQEEKIEKLQEALKVAQHHLNDQSDPFMTARNTIKQVLACEGDANGKK